MFYGTLANCFVRTTTTITIRLVLIFYRQHECCHGQPRNLSRCNATYVLLVSLLSCTHVALVARRIPFDDPDVLNYCRIGYVGAQLVVLAIYYYISMAVSIGPSSSTDQAHTTTCRLNAKTTKRCSNTVRHSLTSCSLLILNPVDPPSPMVRFGYSKLMLLRPHSLIVAGPTRPARHYYRSGL